MSPEAITAVFTSYLGISYGVYRIFEKLGDAVNEDSKINTAFWLLNLNVNKQYKWDDSIIIVFEKVFTKKIWSWKSFIRSIFVSLFLSLILWSFALLFIGDFNIDSDKDARDFLMTVFVIFTICNFVPDYVSIIETRFLLKFSKKYKLIWVDILIVIVDIILTTLIISIALLVMGDVLFSSSILTGYMSLDYVEKTALIYELVTVGKDNLDALSLIFLIPLITTYITSIWIWFHFSATLLLKLLNFTKWGLNLSKKRLDIENKPFRSIGIAFMVIITLIYIIAGICFLIF